MVTYVRWPWVVVAVPGARLDRGEGRHRGERHGEGEALGKHGRSGFSSTREVGEAGKGEDRAEAFRRTVTWEVGETFGRFWCGSERAAAGGGPRGAPTVRG